MNKVFAALACAVLALAALARPALAADNEHRLTHNDKDQDALAIATIREISETEMTLDVARCIVNTNVKNPPKRPEITQARVVFKDWPEGYLLFTTWSEKNNAVTWDRKPKAGDHTLVSLTKNGDAYQIMWGFYQLDGTDHKTAKVLSDGTAASQATAFYITAFINSDGADADFSSAGYEDANGNYAVKVYRDGKLVFNAMEATPTPSPTAAPTPNPTSRPTPSPAPTQAPSASPPLTPTPAAPVEDRGSFPWPILFGLAGIVIAIAAASRRRRT